MNLSEHKKLIIKIGSSLLINESDGSLNKLWVKNLIKEVVELKKNNHYSVISPRSLRILTGYYDRPCSSSSSFAVRSFVSR